MTTLLVFSVGALMMASPIYDVWRRFGEFSDEAFERWLYETPLERIYFFRLQILVGVFFVALGVCLNLRLI